MGIFLKHILLLSFGLCLLVQSIPCVQVDDLDSHLAEYAEVNVTHHDNIADEEPHTHSHKHSKDGEEHEHHHDHTKVTSLEFKVILTRDYVFSVSSFIYVVNGQYEKSFHSTAHPMGLFRPPIS